MPGVYDTEMVEFQTLDGRMIPMTRGAAELMQSEGKGTFTAPPAATNLEGFFTPQAPVHQPPQEVMLGGGPAPSAEIESITGEAPIYSPAPPEAPTPQAPIPQQPAMPETVRQMPEIRVEGAGLEKVPSASFSPEEEEDRKALAATEDDDALSDEDLIQRQRDAELRATQKQQEAMRAEAMGNLSAAEVLKQAAMDDQLFAKSQGEKIQARREQTLRDIEDRKQRVEALSAEISETNIEDNRGFGNKLLAGLAMGIFQMGSTIAGAPGTPNAAMKVINDAVERDLANQRQKLQSKKGFLVDDKNELARLNNALGDMDAAEATLRSIRTGQAVKRAEAMKLQSQGTSREMAAESLVTNLKAQWAQQDTAAKAAQQAAMAKVAEKQAERRHELALEGAKAGAKAAEGARNRNLRRELAAKQRRADVDKIKLSTTLKADEKQAKLNQYYAKTMRESGTKEIERLVGEIQSTIAKTQGDANPQNFFNRLLDDTTLARRAFLDADAQHVLNLVKRLRLKHVQSDIKGAASERDMITAIAGGAQSLSDKPEVFIRYLNDVIDGTKEFRAGLTAETNPFAARAYDAHFKSAKDAQAGPTYSPRR